MGIKDVAGISRPGVFERIGLPGAEGTSESGQSKTYVTPQRGTAASVTFRASGPDATSAPEYRGPNVSSPHTQEWAAQQSGAITPPSAPMWPSAAPMRSKGRR